MLARHGMPPAGPGWVHEIKHDGYRAQLISFGGRLRLYSRNGVDFTGRFGDLAARLRGLPECVLDGEAAVPGPDGVTDFHALHRTHKPVGVVFYAFDVLSMAGEDLRGLPLLERKARLSELLTPVAGARLRLVEHVEGDGAEVLRHAGGLGLEGIVSKKADSRYRSGERAAWIKAKCPAWLEANRDRGLLFGEEPRRCAG